MALNYIWMAFFLVAFVIAFIKWAFMGDQEILVVVPEVYSKHFKQRLI